LAGIIGLGVLMVLVVLARRVHHFGWRGGLKVWRAGSESSRVDFYERLVALLERQGIKREPHQTPMEFATTIRMHEARAITRAYNRVRYGAESLSAAEQTQIEELLAGLERKRQEN
ncbi:MAG TPA: DUF4129 domain-containing protein, partial [Pyrinomonadaceae bacterium]